MKAAAASKDGDRPIDVTVVTPTLDRPRELVLAMRSVAQQVGVEVEHIVLGDECPHLSTPGVANDLSLAFGARVEVISGSGDATYRPARTARLRNLGIEMARGQYVAHLDDDNELEPDHLVSLVQALAGFGERAVAYSWRQMMTLTGEPADLGDRNPWFDDADAARESFADLVGMGVFTPGSNIMRDRPFGPAGEAIHLVDTSEMLVPVALARTLPFRTQFTQAEQDRLLCEDRAFVADALTASIRFVPSGRPTLRYRLGGYSNERPLPEGAS